MAWEVEYTNEFSDWWQTLDETGQNDVAAVVNLLVEKGPNGCNAKKWDQAG